MKLAFSNTVPKDWRDLQNQTARFLNQAGYHAVSPCEISTARGKAEVDVLVDSPDELVKRIICECKYWDSAVPKEKVHAFRTVVADSGASLGLLISKTGFQSGAIEAAKYSNIQLVTWDEFLNIIKDRWILTELRELKLSAGQLGLCFPMKIPYDMLLPEDKDRYYELKQLNAEIQGTCFQLTKTMLIGGLPENYCWYRLNEVNSIEEYILLLKSDVDATYASAMEVIKHSGLEKSIPYMCGQEGLFLMYLE